MSHVARRGAGDVDPRAREGGAREEHEECVEEGVERVVKDGEERRGRGEVVAQAWARLRYVYVDYGSFQGLS